MMGPTHALSGLALYTVTMAVARQTGAELDLVPTLVGAVTCSAAAMLPDIDHPSSTVTRSLGYATRLLCWVIRKLGGGHRRITHSFVGIGILTGLAVLAVLTRHTVGGGVGCCFYVILLTAALVRVLDIEGWVDDILGITFGGVVFLSGADLSAMPIGVALGCLAHILGDLPTELGLPLFFPFSARPVRIPEILRVRVNGAVEHKVIFPALWLVIVGVVVWQTDAVPFVARLVAAI